MKVSKVAATRWLEENSPQLARDSAIAELLDDEFKSGDIDQDSWSELLRQLNQLSQNPLPDVTAGKVQDWFERVAAAPGPTRPAVTRIEEKPGEAPRPPAKNGGSSEESPEEEGFRGIYKVVLIAAAVLLAAMVCLGLLFVLKGKGGSQEAKDAVPSSSSTAVQAQQHPEAELPPSESEEVAQNTPPPPSHPAEEEAPRHPPEGNKMQVACTVTPAMVRCDPPRGCRQENRTGPYITVACGSGEFRSEQRRFSLPKGEQVVTLRSRS